MHDATILAVLKHHLGYFIPLLKNFCVTMTFMNRALVFVIQEQKMPNLIFSFFFSRFTTPNKFYVNLKRGLCLFYFFFFTSMISSQLFFSICFKFQSLHNTLNATHLSKSSQSASPCLQPSQIVFFELLRNVFPYN